MLGCKHVSLHLSLIFPYLPACAARCSAATAPAGCIGRLCSRAAPPPPTRWRATPVKSTQVHPLDCLDCLDCLLYIVPSYAAACS